jgi:hypothetical protein
VATSPQRADEFSFRFIAPEALNPKYGGFELTPPYTILGGVVQQVGRRRAQRKHYD